MVVPNWTCSRLSTISTSAVNRTSPLDPRTIASPWRSAASWMAVRNGLHTSLGPEHSKETEGVVGGGASFFGRPVTNRPAAPNAFDRRCRRVAGVSGLAPAAGGAGCSVAGATAGAGVGVGDDGGASRGAAGGVAGVVAGGVAAGRVAGGATGRVAGGATGGVASGALGVTTAATGGAASGLPDSAIAGVAGGAADEAEVSGAGSLDRVIAQ